MSITLSGDVVNILITSAGQLFTDLWSIIALCIGVPLAFYVARKMVALIPKGRF